MARLKKISIKFREGRGFVVEYRDENGKRPRPTFKTLEDAERHVAMLKGQLVVESKTPSVPQASVKTVVSLKDAIKRYVQSGNDLTPRGLQTAKSHFEKLWLFLVNEQGVDNLSDVSLMNLDAFKAHLKDAGLSPNSIRRMFSTYSPFFNKAVAWGLIAKNPMTGFKKPKEVEANIRTWTKEQFDEVCSNVPSWAQGPLSFLEKTGCRPVDVERLKWSDVDLKSATAIVLSLKGGETRRDTLHLATEVVAMLVTMNYQRKPKPTDLVFMTNRHGPVTADSLQDTVRRVAEKLGFQGLTIYGLRHSFADSLVNMGVHPRDIQLLMRHKKFETTTRYTKRKQDHLKTIVEERSKTFGHKTEVVTKSGHNRSVGTFAVETFETAKLETCQGLRVGAGDRARTDDLYLGKDSEKIA